MADSKERIDLFYAFKIFNTLIFYLIFTLKNIERIDRMIQHHPFFNL